MDKRYIILGGNGGSAEGAVRYDEAQTLTSEQQAQARDNIGAGTSDFSGDYDDLTNKPTIPAAPVQSDWNENDNTSLAYIQNKPTIPSAPVQSDWNEVDNTSLAYIQNKPSIPASPVQSDWNEADNTSLAYIQNKPSIPVLPNYTTETWTFTLSDNTTITRTVYIVPVV